MSKLQGVARCPYLPGVLGVEQRKREGKEGGVYWSPEIGLPGSHHALLRTWSSSRTVGFGTRPGLGNDAAFALSIFKQDSAEVFDRQSRQQAYFSASRL